MLEFIVLGQVPGTQFYITFLQITAIMLFLLVITLVKIDTSKSHSKQDSKKSTNKNKNAKKTQTA